MGEIHPRLVLVWQKSRVSDPGFLSLKENEKLCNSNHFEADTNFFHHAKTHSTQEPLNATYFFITDAFLVLHRHGASTNAID